MVDNELNEVASKGKRFTAGLIDLVLVPVLLGGFLALFTYWFLGSSLFNFLFYITFVAWVLFRDIVFSPGRELVNIKLISLAGNEVTLGQSIKRNILIILPFIGIIGYLIEGISILMTGERVMDPWAKTRVIERPKS